jgi:hypothetical protein
MDYLRIVITTDAEAAERGEASSEQHTSDDACSPLTGTRR